MKRELVVKNVTGAWDVFTLSETVNWEVVSADGPWPPWPKEVWGGLEVTKGGELLALYGPGMWVSVKIRDTNAEAPTATE